MPALFTNYSALTIDDLYHPTLVYIYSVYWDVSLVITTLFFIFVLYTILKKSPKEMIGYQIYLIHQLTWSFLFDLYFGLWKPVPLWPFYLGYSVGWYSNVPKELSLLPLIGITFLSVGMGFSIYISAFHRYMHAVPLSQWYQRYSSLSFRFAYYIVIFLSFECGLCIPIWIFRSDNDQLKYTIIARAGYMEFFFDKYPNLFGFVPELNGWNSVLFMILVLGILVVIIIGIVFPYLCFLKTLRKNKNSLNVNTYHIQKNYSSNVNDLLKMSWKRPFAPDEVDDEAIPSANDSFVDKMGSDVFVVIGLIGLIVLLIIVMVVLNCWLKCCDNRNKGRRHSTKSTDIKYIQQIQKLLERQKEIEARRQAGQRIIVKDE
ncbi:hypothetical protein FO519_009341, partial [Halicephalobus sp. NKZ332]